jgi:hypothetical protein
MLNHITDSTRAATLRFVRMTPPLLAFPVPADRLSRRDEPQRRPALLGRLDGLYAFASETRVVLTWL